MTTHKTYRIHTLKLGAMENFIYVIEDCASRRAAVTDPAWEPDKILALLDREDLQLTDILLTHAHGDHVNAIGPLLARGDIRVHLHQKELTFWSNPVGEIVSHDDGDQIELGETSIELIFTPGHTPGGSCYLLDGDIITGDTLFVYGCGRCDLPGGSTKQMYHSLNKLCDRLPPETITYPGHNYSVKTTATMIDQLAGNPFLYFDDLDAFSHYRLDEHDRVRSSPYDAVPRKR